MLRVFSWEHLSASGFVNMPNGLEMLSQGDPSCPHPSNARPCKSFLRPFGGREASKNFYDIVLPPSHVITDEPFMVYTRQ